ncbi:MAG: hypothetical protein HC767_01525 [Akkermansiaceae bacterium]|nr:hypothetical protein [Akkermansiaceae bacterium]
MGPQTTGKREINNHPHHNPELARPTPAHTVADNKAKATQGTQQQQHKTAKQARANKGATPRLTTEATGNPGA